VDTYAEVCLIALSEAGLGGKLSLGGAFALAYYLEYRETHDIDAWWSDGVTDGDRTAVLTCLEKAMQRFGPVRIRRWGDVVSLDLEVQGKIVFSFQIAVRSAVLVPPGRAPWPDGLLLESLDDLIASKMTALVERGAPRDFRDIEALCREALATPSLCWDRWRRRQELSGGDLSSSRARLAIEIHLSRIELQRPLEVIPDPSERGRAERVRSWFRGEFLDALLVG